MNRLKHSSATSILAIAAVTLGVVGCAQEAETGANSPVDSSVAPEVAAQTGEARVVALAMRDGARSLLNPIHAGVDVRSDDAGAKVAYTRTRGKPYGVAYMLAPNALVECDAISVAISTQPVLRPQLCLTDAAGNIWNAPATQGAAAGEMRFDLTRVQPDPFQNGGKVLPAKADLASVQMVTILDITGFMGGAEAACTWTISAIELHRGGTSGGAVESGGGR